MVPPERQTAGDWSAWKDKRRETGPRTLFRGALGVRPRAAAGFFPGASVAQDKLAGRRRRGDLERALDQVIWCVERTKCPRPSRSSARTYTTHWDTTAAGQARRQRVCQRHSDEPRGRVAPRHRRWRLGPCPRHARLRRNSAGSGLADNFRRSEPDGEASARPFVHDRRVRSDDERRREAQLSSSASGGGNPAKSEARARATARRGNGGRLAAPKGRARTAVGSRGREARVAERRCACDATCPGMDAARDRPRYSRGERRCRNRAAAGRLATAGQRSVRRGPPAGSWRPGSSPDRLARRSASASIATTR